jgi:hypothetical protein
MGLQGKVNISLSTMLDAMVNVSNSEDDAATLRALLAANAGGWLGLQLLSARSLLAWFLQPEACLLACFS